MKKIVILISGRGSNMQAILDARLPLTGSSVRRVQPSGGVSWTQLGSVTAVRENLQANI